MLTGPSGQRWSPEQGTVNEPLVREALFKGPFPEESTFQVEIPQTLSDDAGRTLVNADKFPLSIKTGPFPPLAKFSARFGIIEWKADPTLPVTLRNLEPEVQAKLLRVDKAEHPGARGKLQDLLE